MSLTEIICHFMQILYATAVLQIKCKYHYGILPQKMRKKLSVAPLTINHFSTNASYLMYMRNATSGTILWS